MSDANQRPDAAADHKPQDQTGEDKGAIKRPQRTSHNTQVTDTSRGSEPDTRGSSGTRT